ncbi:MAG: gliding motility-associated C-terminal domain-containing protein [Bacteroidales bacterium]|nr:gliding motility-associated C-terminal domain-containing protein [Bacteroidales bacterium]
MFKKYITGSIRFLTMAFLFAIPSLCAAQDNDFILDSTYTSNGITHYIIHGCNRVRINGSNYSQTGEVTIGTDVYNYTIYKGSRNTDRPEIQCDRYSWDATGETYTTDTNVTTTLRDIYGCDSIVTLQLTFKYSSEYYINDASCDTYQWHDSIYTESQDPAIFDTTNAVGCDSIVKLYLTIYKSDTTRILIDTCESYVWNGVTYTESTDIQHSLLTINECDSIVIFSLNIHHNDTIDVTEVIRENLLPYTYHGATFTEMRDTAGLIFNIKSISNCDSTINYSIHFLANVRTEIDTIVCQNLLESGFRWNAKTFFSTGIDSINLGRTATGSDSYGQYADSIVVMTVSAMPSYHFDENKEICEGESYTFRNNTYTTQGIYPTEYRTTQNCDSNYVLYLTVHPTYNIPIAQSICSNAPVSFCSYNYSEAGTYTCTMTSIHGCDSTITLSLSVADTTIGEVYDTILENDLPWTYRDITFDTFSQDIQHRFLLDSGNVNGCDSIIRYHLIIYQNVYDTIDSTICSSNFPILWNTLTFAADESHTLTLTNHLGADSILTMRTHAMPNPSQTYNDTIVENQLPITFYGTTFYDAVSEQCFSRPAIGPCDSIIIYNLHVLENTLTRIDTTVCEGTLPITWRGHDFAEVGWTYDTLNGTDGTDSILAYFLTTSPHYNDTFSNSICSNQTISFGNKTYDTAGTFTYQTLSQFGCDSTATMILTVNPVSNTTEYDTIIENQLYERHGTLNNYFYCYYHNGQCFNDSVSHSEVTILGGNQYQCDSIIDYSLYVYWNHDTTLYDTLCGNELPYIWMGKTFSASNTYGTLQQDIDTLTVHGADSIIHLSLTVHNNYLIEDNEVVCEPLSTTPYQWYDTLIQESKSLDTFYLPRKSVYGCDSLHTLYLTTATHTFDTIFDTIVENQTKGVFCYQFNGHPFCDTSTITDSTIIIPNHAGCDSNISYNLFVHKNTYTYDTTVICADQLPLTWNYTRFVVESLPEETTQGKSRSGILQDSIALRAQTGADSIIHMTVYVFPTYHIDRYDTICDDSSITFLGRTYSETTVESRNMASVDLCDSIWTIHLQSYKAYDQEFFDTIYEDEWSYFGGYAYNHTGDYTSSLTTIHYCDSILTLHLIVYHKTLIDSTICRNMLPITWNGMQFSSAGTKEQTLTDIYGLDSLVIMTLHVQDTSFARETVERCNAYTWRNGKRYTESTNSESIRLTNDIGCDSVIYLSLSIFYDQNVVQKQQSCDNYTWINGRTYDTSIYGPTYLLKSSHGCDSLVTLDLHIDYSFYEEWYDSICEGQTYYFRGHALTQTSTTYDSLTTHKGCDSITAMFLTVLPIPSINLDYTTDCENGTHTISVNTSVAYVYWSTFPADPTLSSQAHNQTITVAPKQNTTYILYADYNEYPTCPASDSLYLRKIYQPVAKLMLTPDYLTYDNMELTAIDLSENDPDRQWYVNDIFVDNDSSILKYKAEADDDTIHIMLAIANGYCTDTAYAAIKLLKPNIFAPNVFTPGLQNNNIFYVIGNDIYDYEIAIYDRRGQILFHSTDISEGWDGTSNGELCPQGNYVYVIRYQAADVQNSVQTYTGSVILLR